VALSAIAGKITGETITRIAEAGFLVLAILDAWLIVDTERALRLLGQRGLVRPVLAHKRPCWVWFYRIDAILVLIGFVQYFAAGKLFR
jgi:hypothetical protein